MGDPSNRHHLPPRAEKAICAQMANASRAQAPTQRDREVRKRCRAAQEKPSKRLREATSSLRVIDVLAQHVQAVVDLALEVAAVEVFGEGFPPAHVHHVADKLVEAL